MRVLLPVVLLVVSLLLLAGMVLLCAGVAEMFHTRRSRRSGPSRAERSWNAAYRWLAKREARRQAQVPWTHYSEVDPLTGDYRIGIRRVYRDTVLDDVEIQRVPAGDHDGRLEWEGAAMVRAIECNDNRNHP